MRRFLVMLVAVGFDRGLAFAEDWATGLGSLTMRPPVASFGLVWPNHSLPGNAKRVVRSV